MIVSITTFDVKMSGSTKTFFLSRDVVFVDSNSTIMDKIFEINKNSQTLDKILNKT